MASNDPTLQKVLSVRAAKQAKMEVLKPKSITRHEYTQDLNSLDESSFVAKYGAGATLDYKFNTFKKTTETAFGADSQIDQNTNLLQDIGTAAAVSLGDNLPSLGAGLIHLATANNDGTSSLIGDAAKKYMLAQQAEAEESKKEFSKGTQQDIQNQQQEAATRNLEFDQNSYHTFGEHISNFGSAVEEYVTNPNAAAVLAAESADSLVTLPVGGLFAGAIAKNAIKKKIAQEVKDATASQLKKESVEAARERILEAGIGRIANAKAKAASTTGVALTGVTEGGHNAIGALQDIEGMSVEELAAKSPEYNQLLADNPEMTYEEAKNALVLSIAKNTGVKSGALAALIGKASGASDLFSKALLKNQAKSVGVKQAGTNIAKGAGTEGIEEILQSGGGQTVANIEAQRADPRRKISKGVADAAAGGLVAGAVTGGAIATVTETLKGASTATKVGIEKTTEKLRVKSSGDPELDKLLAEINELEAPIRKKGKAPEAKNLDTEKVESIQAKVLDMEARRDLADEAGDQTKKEKINKDISTVEQAGANTLDIKAPVISKKEIDDITSKLDDPALKAQMEELLSFQIDDDVEIEDLEKLSTKAEKLGVDTTSLKEVIEIRKSMQNVSDDILKDNDDFSGAETYLNNIRKGLKHNAPAYVLKTLNDMHRFSEHMTQKAADFNAAMKESVETGEMIFLEKYMTTGENPKPAQIHYKRSEDLVPQVQHDAEVLAALTQKAEDMVNGSEASVQEAVAKVQEEFKVETPVIEEATQETPVTEEATPEVKSEGQVEDKVEERTFQDKMTARIAEVINPSAKKAGYLPKEQVKTRIATQFIGEGAPNSSTAKYRTMYAFDSKANTGTYTAEDTVFISSNGKRGNRIAPVINGELQGEYKNIDLAIEAGATFVVDTVAHLTKTKKYNIGEMAVGNYLAAHGYSRVGESGIWKPKNIKEASKSDTPVEAQIANITSGITELEVEVKAQRKAKNLGNPYDHDLFNNNKQRLGALKKKLVTLTLDLNKNPTEVVQEAPSIVEPIKAKPSVAETVRRAEVISEVLDRSIKAAQGKAKEPTRRQALLIDLRAAFQDGSFKQADFNKEKFQKFFLAKGYIKRTITLAHRLMNQQNRALKEEANPDKATKKEPTEISSVTSLLNKTAIKKAKRKLDKKSKAFKLLQQVEATIEDGNLELELTLMPNVSEETKAIALKALRAEGSAQIELLRNMPSENPIIADITAISEDTSTQALKTEDIVEGVKAAKESIEDTSNARSILDQIAEIYLSDDPKQAAIDFIKEGDDSTPLAIGVLQRIMQETGTLESSMSQGDKALQKLTTNQMPLNLSEKITPNKNRVATDVNVIFLEETNELKDEGSISKTSFLGNQAENITTEMFAEPTFVSPEVEEETENKVSPKERRKFEKHTTPNFKTSLLEEGIISRLEKEGVSSDTIEDLLIALEGIDPAFFIGNLQRWFTNTMTTSDEVVKKTNDEKTEAKKKNNPYNTRKLYTRRKSLLADTEGNLSSLFSVSGIMGTLFNLSITQFTPTIASLKRFVGLRQENMPETLAGYLVSRNIGIPERDLASDIGGTMLEMTGMRFDGSHANTQENIQYTLGQMMVDFLKQTNVLTVSTVSTTAINRLGGDITLNPPNAKTKNRFQGTKTYADIALNYSTGAFDETYPAKEIFITNNKVYYWKAIKTAGEAGTYTRAKGSMPKFIQDGDLTPAEVGLDQIKTIQLNESSFLWKRIKEHNLKDFSSLIAKAFNVESVQGLPSLDAPLKNKDKINGQVSTLSKTIVKNADKNSKVKHFLSKRADQILDLVDDKVILKMLGWKDLETTKLLPSKVGIQESKNLDAERALAGYRDFKTNIANEKGEDVFNEAYYYNYDGQPYHRLGVASQLFNAQTMKFHRFMSHLTPKTLDMNNNQAKTNFLMAVAQAVGVKVDNQTTEISYTQLNAKVEEIELKYGKVLENLQAAVKGEKFDQGVIDNLFEASGEAEVTHTLQGLIEYAHYKNAVHAKAETFEVTLSIEIDGRNNGPVTVLLMSATSTETALAYLKRAGITDASVDARSVGQRMAAKEATVDDTQGIYEDVAASVQKEVAEQLDTTQQDYNERGQEFFPAKKAKERLMAQLKLKAQTELITVSKDENTIEVERLEAKENLTVQAFYGSGEASLTQVDISGLLNTILDTHQDVFASLAEDATELTEEQEKVVYANFDLLASAAMTLPSPEFIQKVINSIINKKPLFSKEYKAWVAEDHGLLEHLISQEIWVPNRTVAARDKAIRDLLAKEAKDSYVRIYGSLVKALEAQAAKEKKSETLPNTLGLDMRIPDNISRELKTALEQPQSYSQLKFEGLNALYPEALKQFKLIRNILNMAGPVARDRYLQAYTTKLKEKGYSRYQDLSVKDKKEMERSIMSIMPTFSLDMHNDKTNFMDAIAEYKWEGIRSQLAPPELRSLGNLGTGLDSYLKTRLPTSIGSGANPSTTIPIADASVVNHLFSLGIDFFSVFDGYLINALDQDILADSSNTGYLESILKNNQLQLVKESHLRVFGENFAEVVNALPIERLTEMVENIDADYLINSGLWQDYEALLKRLSQERKEDRITEARSMVNAYLTHQRSDLEHTLSNLKLNETLDAMESKAVNQFGSANERSVIIGKDTKEDEGTAEVAPDIEKLAKNERIYHPAPTAVIYDEALQLEEAAKTPEDLTAFLQKMLSSSKLPKTYSTYLKTILIDKIIVPALVGSGIKLKLLKSKQDLETYANELNTFDKPIADINEQELSKEDQKKYRKIKAEQAKVLKGKYKGFYDFNNNTVVLHTQAGANIETLLHELIHAALDDKLRTKWRANRKGVKKLIAGLNTEVIEAWNEAHPNKTFPIAKFEEIDFSSDKDMWKMQEVFAWGLTNFDFITALQAKESLVGKTSKSLLSQFATGVIKLVHTAVNWVLGKSNADMQDSVLSFLVGTSVDLAGGTINTEDSPSPVIQESLVFQDEVEAISKATPEQVFDSLLQDSDNGPNHKNYLSRLFHTEIKRIQESKTTLLKEKGVNAMEALISLEADGVSVLPHAWEGLFPMSNVESYLFNSYREIINVGLDKFSLASTEISDIFKAAQAKLEAVDFLLPDESESNTIAMQIAQDKFDAVFNSADSLSAGKERYSYLADFAALSRTNEEFRNVLQKKVGIINREKDGVETLASKLLDIVAKVLNFMTGTFTGSNKSKSFKGKMDLLSKKLSVAEFKAKGYMESTAKRALSKGGKVYTAYAKWMGKQHAKISNSDTVNAVSDAVGATLSATADALTGANNAEQAKRYALLNKKLYRDSGRWIIRLMETEFTTAKGYNRDLRRAFFMKSKAVAGAADSANKDIKSILKKDYGSLASNKQTMSALTDGVIRTDLSVFHDENVSDLMDLFKSPEELQAKVTELENKLLKHKSGNALINASHSLGHFQIHHKGTEQYTFPNAASIALNVSRIFKEVLTSEEATIDQLASLVAVQQLSEDTRAKVYAAYKEKPEAIRRTIELHKVQKQVEIDGRYDGDKYAPLKGQVAEIYNESRDIKVVARADVADLRHDGYRELTNVKLERNTGDVYSEPMVVMYSSVGGLLTHTQGAYSTATNQKGIKNLDGRTITNGFDAYDEMQKHSLKITAAFKGDLRASNVVRKSRKITNNGTMTSVSKSGGVIGQYYTIGLKDKQRYLGKEDGLLSTLPSMYARNVLVTNTIKYNRKVNEAMKAGYDFDKERGQLHKYFEVSPNAPTKEGVEAYRMMPPEARAHAKTIWGDKIYVRSSLYEMTYGYRKVSMANIIRANSDSPQWAKALIRNTLGLFLTDAQLIKGITVGGRALEEAVGHIKDMIVVRSINVLIDNLLSNTVQLVLENEGMTISKAVRYTLEGLRLAKRYQDNSAKLNRLRYNLTITEAADKTEIKKLKSAIAVLVEEQAKNPAGDLIEKGALTAIVEDLGDNANPYSYTAKLGEKYDKYTKQLPDSVQWVVGNMVGSKKSEWYQTAYKFTQLGDFGSRYAMYKNARENGTMNEKFMDRIIEAFVVYDFPSNKYLEWLGGTGTLWFMKYFLRIQSIMLRNIKENPRKVAEFATLLNMGGVDIPSYYQALFLANPITNKFGLLEYGEKGIESLPIVHMYEAAF